MKLNGASKPRQGASKQGSSPGVVLKKYRVKRYLKVNKNVVYGLPLNACGSTNKKSVSNDNKVINCNYISNDKQQRVKTSISQQPKQKRKCDETFSNKNSLGRINFSTLIRLKKRIDLTTLQCRTTQFRVSAIAKTEFCKNNLNNKIAAAAAVAAVAAATVKAKDIKRKTNIQKDFWPEAIINITTRQIINFKLEEESVKNKNNNISIDKRITRQVNNNVTKNKSLIGNNKNKKPKSVNKFLFVPKLNAYPNLKANLLRSFIQLRLFLFSLFLHAIRYLKGKPFACLVFGSGRGASNSCSKTFKVRHLGFRLVGFTFAKMMRASQLLVSLFEGICLKNAKGPKAPIALYMVIYAVTAILLPNAVVGDDGDTFFPVNGIETTTPEFDYASRGQKKFGDKCDNTLECGFPGSICDPKKKSCQCTEDLPVTNHIDKCGKEAAVNESCFFNEQCEVKYFQTECRDQRCVCRFDMTPIWLKDGSVECKGRGDKKGPETYIDPAMIGVLVGMALMFIIICVVLRLFSQARWRENRTIFNTPNPRLMNVSLLRESKLLHGQERRGSRMSVRAPSRQPSMASLRPHSPNPSLGKTGRMTRSKSNTRSSDSRVSDASNCSRLLEHHATGSRSNSHGSNASATSIRSTRSNCVSPAGITVGNNSHHERKGSTYQPHQHHHPQQQKLQTVQQQDEEPQLMQTNIISNPVAETITVEIIETETFTKSSE